MKYLRRRRLTYLVAATPALAFFLFQLWPLGYAAVSALTDAAGRPTLGHFAEVYSQPIFRRAAINNLIIPIAGVALEAAVGLGMALWFVQLRRGRNFWRTIAIIPAAVPEIVYLLTMKLVFRPHGYLNSL